jgi:hypothetical protein
MKTIYMLLSLMMVLSCENKNVKSVINHDPSTLKNNIVVNENSKQDNFVSVVKGIKPERTITVGSDRAEVKGYASQSIRTAVDAIHNLGGSVVKILPGNYNIIAPIKIYSNISLIGAGSSTIVKKSKRCAFI